MDESISWRSLKLISKIKSLQAARTPVPLSWSMLSPVTIKLVSLTGCQVLSVKLKLFLTVSIRRITGICINIGPVKSGRIDSELHHSKG